MHHRQRILRALPVVLLLLTIAHAQPRPLTPSDLLRVATVGDPQISPTGEWIVYTLSTAEGNEPNSNVWLVRVGERPLSGPPTGRQPEQRRNWEGLRLTGRPLLPSGWNASNPRWSPDGKSIAFLGAHEEQRGIWVTSTARVLPRLVAEVRETNFFITYAGERFAWSPDSRMIAYISATEEESGKGDDPRVIDRIQYKSRTSLSDRLRSHVWIADVDTPQPHQLTAGMFYDHALSFSPRGDEVAFLSNHETDPDANNNSDIFAVNLQGQLRQITATAGCEYEPAWSPDGKWIAYTATKRDLTTIDSVAEDAHVWITSSSGDVRRELTAAQDRRARNPRWQADSRAIYFLANDHGQTLVFQTDLNGEKIQPIFGAISEFKPVPAELKGSLDSSAPTVLDQRIQVAGYSVAEQASFGDFESGPNRYPLRFSALAAIISDPTHPGEVWIERGNILTRVTNHNDPFRRGSLIEPQEFRFKTFDGTETQGWLIKPAGWREDRKYPLILNIHGGPHGMYGYAFNANFQIIAARGYAVVYINPRGSSGYGQRFSDGTI